MEKIVYNALRTPDGTVLESRSRHDYKTYTDANGKEYMVDGGLDYLRRNAHDDYVDLSVCLDDGHEQVREALKWGTRGPNGDQPLKYIKLCDMDTDHIQACLETQSRMYPQIRAAMQNELLWRDQPWTQTDQALRDEYPWLEEGAFTESSEEPAKSLEDLLVPFSEQFQKARDEYEADNDSWWNNLSEQEREHAFYAVVKRIYQGDVVDGGSYRYVLYDVFGFDPGMYGAGMSCGYMELHNILGDGIEYEQLKNIDRLEVIDHGADDDGRELVKQLSNNDRIDYMLQDDNATLKIFISGKTKDSQ